MEQAVAPTGERRWWIYLSDGSRKLTWKHTAQDALEAASAKGWSVDRVETAGSPLSDR
jgi:hypothetical protein